MSVGRQFELIRELGSGSFGTVYLAEMVSRGGFRKQVALKVLKPEVDGSQDAATRLRDEARLLGRLRHRHIVQVDDLVRLDGRWAVVMEHVTGHDLVAVAVALQRAGETFPPRAAAEVVLAVCKALEAAWNSPGEAGTRLRVIHRDIKPSNLRMTDEGEVKVLDFGIARADFQGRETETGSVRFGSVPYMSPERLLGGEDDPAGDVYSVGCVFYELVMSERLGRCELRPDIYEERLADTVAAFTRASGGPPELGALLGEMLAYELEDRPTAAQVIERLTPIADDLPGASLAAFSRAFMPRVGDYVADGTRTAEGVLSEETLADLSVLDRAGTGFRKARLGQGPGGPSSGQTLAPASSHLLEQRTVRTEPAPAVPIVKYLVLGLLMSMLIGIPAIVWGIKTFLPQPGPAVGAIPGETPAATDPPQTTGEPAAVQEDPTPPTQADPAQAGDEPATDQADPGSAPAEPAASGSAPSGSVQAASASAQADHGPNEPAVVAIEPVAPGPQDPDPAEAEPAATTAIPLGPSLRAVKFSLSGATRLAADCSGVAGAGTSSVLLRNVPSGTCQVQAELDGASYSTQVQVSRPSGLTCAVADGALRCQ